MRRLFASIRDLKSSPIAWGVWLIVATLLYFAASRLLQDLIYGDPPRPANFFGSYGPDFWRPEPLEIPFYVLGYVVIPLLAWFGYLAHRRGWLHGLAVPILLAAALALVASGLVLLVWVPQGLQAAVAYAAEHGVAKGLWLLLTKRLFALRLLFALVGAYLLAQLFTSRSRIMPLLALDQWRGWRWAQPLLLLAVVAFLFHPNFPMEPHHYAYFLGPANDMLHGKALLYETSHLYGLLNEYALAGLFALGLPLTDASLSAVLFAAFAGFILGWYFLLRRWLDSRTLAAIGVLSTVAWLFLFQTSPTRSVYQFPAMTPWRFWPLLPVAWLLLTQARMPTHRRRLLIVLTASLAIFWNMENGIFMAVAAWLCLIYMEVGGQSSEVRTLRSVVPVAGRSAALFMVCILAIGGAISTVNFAFVGHWPDWLAYLREVLPFGAGIVMIPLPSVGLFELFVVAYVATLTWTLRRLLRREPIDVGALFFALFGAASLLYYVSQSTWQNLYLVTPPLIGLLLWLVGQLLRRPPADYSVVRLAAAGVNAALVLVAGMLLLKVPVELAARDYAAVAASFRRPVISDAALAADAAVLRRDFGQLPRLAVVHRSDVPLLLTLGKANALDVYTLSKFYTTQRVDALLAQIEREQPPVIIVGRVGSLPDQGLDPDDQVRYFRAHLPPDYRVTQQLHTLDVYERTEAASLP